MRRSSLNRRIKAIRIRGVSSQAKRTKMETTTRKVAEELFSIAPGDGLEEKYKTKSRKKKHESTTYVISVLK